MKKLGTGCWCIKDANNIQPKEYFMGSATDGILYNSPKPERHGIKRNKGTIRSIMISEDL